MIDSEHLEVILSMMSIRERMALLSRIMGFAEGGLRYYEILSRQYEDIHRVELIRESPFSKLRIVCKPDYNVDSVLDFVGELFLGLDYEVVVEDGYDLVK